MTNEEQLFEAVEPRTFRAEELAEVLGISRAHVWRMHNRGRLPAPLRFGRSVRWHRDTIEAWLLAGAPPRHVWERRDRDAQPGPQMAPNRPGDHQFYPPEDEA